MTDTHTSGTDPIDVVITWVDGNDPSFKTRRSQYLHHGEDKHDDVAGATRYASVGEIYLCLASINRFASFVHHIYIVTDGQQPTHLDAFLQQNFPEGFIPYTIVDHSIIFAGYEQCLPVFNSRAIETMLWRIPGLSERYVYFNDDVMLLSPVTADDFFVDDATCCYAKPYSTCLARFLHALKKRHNGHKPMGFKLSLMNAMRYTGLRRRFLFLLHTPMALRRSRFEQLFERYPEAVETNLSQRFRHPSQFNPQELFYLTEQQQGRCIVKPSHENVFYFKPKGRQGYTSRKVHELTNTQALFACMNSLDQASPKDREDIVQCLTRRIGCEFYVEKQ